MCVIVLAEDVRPTEDQIHKMWDKNPWGGGVAWREEIDGVVRVRWEKGLEEDDMVARAMDLPLPFVMHFRRPSQGTSSSVMACHPFVIGADADYQLSGETPQWVLFHNGYWNKWRETIMDIAVKGYVIVPSGPWSDSRAMAWTAHHLGLGMLEMIDEKAVAFGPDDIELFGGYWSKVVGDDGEKKLFVSNITWDTPSTAHSTTTVTTALHQGYSGGGSVALTQQPQASATAGSPGVGPVKTFRDSDGSTTQGTESRDIVKETLPQAPATAREFAQSGTNSSLACARCHKRTNGGWFGPNNKYYCAQCWSAEQHKTQVVLPGSEYDAWWSICGLCKTHRTVLYRRVDDVPICDGCFLANGQPEVYSTVE